MKLPRILINPRVAWACQAGEQAGLEFVDGQGADWPALPGEGDLLTLAFILCPQTKAPVPVRVAQILHRQEPEGSVVVIVVSRADLPH